MSGVHDEAVHRDEPYPRGIRQPGGADVVLNNAYPYLHQVPHFLGLGGQGAGGCPHEGHKVLPTHVGGLGPVEEEVVLADDVNGSPTQMAGLPLSKGEGRFRASFRSKVLASWAYSSSRWARHSSSENVMNGRASSWALRAMSDSPEPV